MIALFVFIVDVSLNPTDMFSLTVNSQKKKKSVESITTRSEMVANYNSYF